MKRTLLFLTFAACIGLQVIPAKANFNPIAGLNLNVLKNCKLVPEVDKTKLGVALIVGSLAAAVGADVFDHLYKRAKSFCKLCYDNPTYAIATPFVIAGVYYVGAGSTQNLNAIPVIK